MSDCLSSIAALPLQCPKSRRAGVNELYLIAYQDLAQATGVTNGDKFAVSATTGMITDIGLASGKTFVQVGLIKDAVDLNSSFTIDMTKGSAFYSPKLELTLAGNTAANIQFMESVQFQKVAFLIKDRNGDWFAFGMDGETFVTAATQSFGKAAGDDFGFKITFEGTAGTPILQVDPTKAVTLYA